MCNNLAKNADKIAAYFCKSSMCGKVAENAAITTFLKI